MMKRARMALEAIADWHRENVYVLPMFDLFAIYGINPKLRALRNPALTSTVRRVTLALPLLGKEGPTW